MNNKKLTFISMIVVLTVAAFFCFPIAGGIKPVPQPVLYEGTGIDFTMASCGLLQTIDGIGESRALAIQDFIPETSDSFDLESLAQIKGIGPKCMEAIRKNQFHKN